MSRKGRVTLSLSSDLIDKLNERRGLAKMSTYVEDILEKALSKVEETPSGPMARVSR